MPQMARKPFIPTTMGQLRGLRQGPRKKPVWATKRAARPRLIILNILGLLMRAILSVPGAACDRYPQFWPVPWWRSDRLHRLTAAFSFSPTKRTAMGSTSASPPARMRRPCRALLLPVARVRPCHILSARRPGRNHWLGSEGGFKLPSWRVQRIRRHYLSTLKRPPRQDRPATPTPRKRRDAAPRSGYGSRLVPVCDIRGMSRHPE